MARPLSTVCPKVKERVVSAALASSGMARTLTKDRLLKVVLFVLVVATVVDPTEDLVPHLKYGSLVVFAVMAVVFRRTGRLAEYRARALVLYVIGFAALLPAYGIAVHFVRGDHVGGPWSIYAGSNIFLTLAAFVAIAVPRVYFEKLVVGSLTGVAGLTWLLFLASTLLPAGALYDFGASHNLYALQTRTYAGLSFPNVYYYTSPMMVLALAYWGVRFSRREGGWRVACAAALVAGAMFLSGTRTSMLMALALTMGFLWRRSRRACVALVVCVAAFVVVKAHVISAMVASGDVSNSTKLDYFDAYGRLFSDPLGLIFGYGLGSCLDSAVLKKCIPVTELTYIDLIRVFGILGGVAYLALLGILLWWLRRSSPYVLIGFGGYLVMSALNPYIFSTNGMLLLSVALLNALSRHPGRDRPWTYRRSVPRDETRAPVREASPSATPREIAETLPLRSDSNRRIFTGASTSASALRAFQPRSSWRNVPSRVSRTKLRYL